MARRDLVAAFWDDAVARFFRGENPQGDNASLVAWFRGYKGGGRGTVTTEAFPEPYIGPLSSAAGQPLVVALGLNPGEADMRFQGRDGVFADEIAQLGGFSRWAVTEPYLREPWRSTHRPNVYHERLRTFAQRWTGCDDLRSRDVLVMELFPWHSDKVTSTMRPAPEVIDRFVWQPIADFDIPFVFAFGAPWGETAGALGLPEIEVTANFASKVRNLRLFALPSGQRLAVVWQPGYAGPPGGLDVAVLKRALGHAGDGLPQSPPPASRPVPSIVHARPSSGSGRTGTTRATDYERFWSGLIDRLCRELPGVQPGAAKGNDLPLYSPLRHAKLKFNFPAEGLRMELLLTSTDRAENLSHLNLLRDYLPALQAAFGPEPRIETDDLERRQRTQARVAVYLPGAQGADSDRWPEFQDWLIDVLRRFRDALDAMPELSRRW